MEQLLLKPFAFLTILFIALALPVYAYGISSPSLIRPAVNDSDIIMNNDGRINYMPVKDGQEITQAVYRTIVYISSGSDSIESIDFDVQAENFDITSVYVVPVNPSNVPTDLGSVNQTTFEWNGQLDSGQSFFFAVNGIVNGDIGDEVSISISLLSSTVLGGTPNDDPNPSSPVTFTNTIEDVWDFGFEVQWLTDTTVRANEPFQLAGVISNVGTASYPGADWEIPFYIVMPSGSTFVSVVDDDPSDGLTPTCQSEGNAGDYLNDEFNSTAYDAYDDEIVVCQLASDSGDIAPGEELAITINGTAGTDGLTAGVSKLIGFVMAPDGYEIESAQIIEVFDRDEDVFDLAYNNMFNETFNPGSLVATITRCEGQSEVTSANSACFKVSFNREVNEGTFDASDITISGGGTVSSFVQESTNEWTVTISGMTANTTITVGLLENATIDAYGVANSVSVLGTNTVRYSPNGTLPTTGNNTNVWFPLSFLISGIVILIASRSRVRMITNKKGQA